MSLWSQLALLVVLGWGAHAETGCPPPEDIQACSCTDFPSTRLTCYGLVDTEVIRDVFKKSERYFYHEVYIRSSTLVYIPHEIFDRTEVGELFVTHSVLGSLFDSPPNSDSLYKIELDNTHFYKEIIHEKSILKNLTGLRVIVFNKSYGLKKIPADFSSRLPSSLNQITFNDTAIRSIAPGAFDNFTNLDKFALHFSQLNNLTRDIFPRHFNIRFLYFDHNRLSSLPDDLFTDMPNLQFLTLRNNSLSVLPEAAFAGRSTNVPYIGLEGNPLNCNCLLLWLIKDKPEVLDGTCASPIRLRGRQLQNLAPADFNC